MKTIALREANTVFSHMIWKCSILKNFYCPFKKQNSSALKSAQWLLEMVTDTNSILFMKMF